MKKRTFKMTAVMMASAILTITAASTAFAGTWKQDAKGWWWQEDNGSYPVSQWKWLDGNQNGVSECYCFDGNGYLFTNTTTPDGYTVNGDGQWTDVSGMIGSDNYLNIPITDNYHIDAMGIQNGVMLYDIAKDVSGTIYKDVN